MGAHGAAIVPIVVLTGFLGAGKTTLLNAALRDPAFSRSAVIVNEFGAVGIDHHLVERVEGDLLVLTSGCLCCAARGDLTEALFGLLDRRARGTLDFDRMLVETSGLADPGPILNATLLDHRLWPLCRVETLVVAVEAPGGGAMLEAHEEAARQVALADRVVLTKTDLLVVGDTEAATQAAIRALNRWAPILDTSSEIAALFAPGPPPPERLVNGAGKPTRAATRRSLHAGIETGVLRSGPTELRRVEVFLVILRERHGGAVLRLKGFVALLDAPDRPLLVQMVGHFLHPATARRAWPDADRGTRLVVILKDLPFAVVAALWDDIVGAPAIDRPDAAALAGDPARAGLFA